MPVGQLAQPVIEIRIDIVHDSARQGRHPPSGQSSGRGDAGTFQRAQRDAGGRGVKELFGRMIGTGRKTDLIGEHIGSAAGQHAEDHVRSGDAIDGFVDSAVATRCQDEVAAGIDGDASEFPGAIRPRSCKEFDGSPCVAENLYGRIQTRAPRPFQSTGERVVNDSDTMK